MKTEYTPTHHHREHNASKATQASFLATFKAIRNKLGHRYTVPVFQRHYAVYDIL